MSLLARAALKATVVLLVCAALMWVPPIRMLVYLPGLGHELNGFFVLSAAAWSLAAMVLWLIAFRFFYMRAKRRVAAQH